jgi:hypothetical protein
MRYILHREAGRIYYFGGLNPETPCALVGNALVASYASKENLVRSAIAIDYDIDTAAAP